MWGTIMNINSMLWVAGAIYFLYAFAIGILTFEWKQFLIAFLIMVFLTGTEIVLSALAE